jgi:hypothetical protein
MTRRAIYIALVAMSLFLLAVGIAGTDQPPTQRQYDTTTDTNPTGTVIHGTPKPAEDNPGFDCRTQGNRICGPGTSFPAGCYSGGSLVIPWTNYLNPRLDPLWAQVESPC